MPWLEVFSVHGAYRYPESLLDRGYTISISYGGEPPPMRYRGLDLRSAGPDTITVVEPDEVLRPLIAGPVAAHFTAFTLLDPRPLSDATPDRELPRFSQLTYSDRGLRAGFAALHTGLENGLDHEMLHTMLADLLRKLVNRHAAAPGTVTEPHRPLATVRQILRDRLDSNIGLDELAAVAGCSRHHLLRTFRLAYGVPPHRYRNLLRLAAARTLLAQGLPATEVASRVGYYDQSQLNRHFRQAFGFSAGSYARTVR